MENGKWHFQKVNWLYPVLIVLFVLIPFFIILSSNKGSNKTRDIQNSIANVTRDFQPSHKITLPGNKGRVTFRNRALSAREFMLIGSQNAEGRKLHEDTYVGILSQGTRVQLLDQIGPSLKVRFQMPDGRIKEGYIAITVEGQSTLTGIK